MIDGATSICAGVGSRQGTNPRAIEREGSRALRYGDLTDAEGRREGAQCVIQPYLPPIRWDQPGTLAPGTGRSVEGKPASPSGCEALSLGRR
jgi:hypothetical protein